MYFCILCSIIKYLECSRATYDDKKSIVDSKKGINGGCSS
jgi:hypothetical protein